tara:strand:- start:18 stop:713 length:696 start_codon:yes stop_codon:yes gene_type:complete
MKNEIAGTFVGTHEGVTVKLNVRKRDPQYDPCQKGTTEQTGAQNGVLHAGGWYPPVIFVEGIPYVAASVDAAITCGWQQKRGTVRFSTTGRGRGKAYLMFTADLALAWMKMCSPKSADEQRTDVTTYRKRTVQSIERDHTILAFVKAIGTYAMAFGLAEYGDTLTTKAIAATDLLEAGVLLEGDDGTLYEIKSLECWKNGQPVYHAKDDSGDWRTDSHLLNHNDVATWARA